MDTTSQETVLTLELKYCEWCGALWFRPPESVASYCEGCTRWIRSQLPAGRREET
jgi:hypothetical protein